MTRLLTADEMRAVERAAMESGAVTGLELMERAGRGAVDAILAEWPDLHEGPRSACVLCGPGNNGGDGFVVARLLLERGWDVRLHAYGDVDALAGDAATAAERWQTAGGGVLKFEAFGTDGAAAADLIVDGLFGTGLTRPLEDDAAAALTQAARTASRIVALDMISGICSDSGRLLIAPDSCLAEAAAGGVPRADLVVSFHAPKRGHVLADGADRAGALRVVDIGLWGDAPDAVIVAGRPGGGVLKSAGHKYDHGHALVLSGGPGRGGAARLAARGALRIGAGLVTLGCPPAALQENASRLDAIMTRPVKGADGLAEMLGADERLTAICIGPGFGAAAARDAVPAVLAARRETVLDGDALTAFADDPEDLFDALHAGCVLTPHAGEFARLFPDLARRLEGEPNEGPAYSKVDAVRAAAARAGCVVLLKGADTAIAGPDGDAAIHSARNERAAPWLATAGAGDVLAGFITGLLARKEQAMDAAATAAWLHVECALRFGPGLIAEDLPETLPAVLRDLARTE